MCRWTKGQGKKVMKLSKFETIIYITFQDSCVGDSGSGLMRSRRDPSRGGASRSELIGVVSFGPRLCGTEGVPGVYSRVESFLPWILDTVQNN